jgi:hypothetical protein
MISSGDFGSWKGSRYFTFTFSRSIASAHSAFLDTMPNYLLFLANAFFFSDKFLFEL